MIFPLVALIVSGGHTFLVEMRDHLTYRLLGETVDDAAGEAFDKVGRLLGLPYPGGPSIQRAAESATRHDAAFPRAWLGDSYDFSFSGPQDRRATDGRRGEGRRGRAGPRSAPDCPTRRPPSCWGFQAVVDVSRRRRSGPPSRRGTVDRAGRRRGGERAAAAWLAEAAGLGLPLVVPRPGCARTTGR